MSQPSTDLLSQIATQIVLSSLAASDVQVKAYQRQGKHGAVQVQTYKRHYDRPMTGNEIKNQLAQGRNQVKAFTKKKKADGKRKAMVNPMALFPDNRIRFGDVTLDVNSQKEIFDTWNSLAKAFPTVANEIKEVAGKPFKKDDWSFGEASNLGDKIALNSVYLRDRALLSKALKMNEQDHFFAQGTSKLGWKYIITHEFGHAVFSSLSSEAQDKWMSHWEKTPKKSLTAYSNYAAWDFQEGFAEAFANVNTHLHSDFTGGMLNSVLKGLHK